MSFIHIICVAALALCLNMSATQAANREVPRRARTTAGKAATLLIPGKKIEPLKAVEEGPAARWSGFYFGLNAGAAASKNGQ
jgi:hypothetical protein